MIIRAYESTHGTSLKETDINMFTDSTTVSKWAVGAVSKAKQLGLIDGYKTGEFRPQGKTSRAESAKLIHLMK